MSKIPHPDVVARGALPGPDVLLWLAWQAISEFSLVDNQLVPYGSLVRGDATWRSNINLCRVPSSHLVAPWMWDTYIQQLYLLSRSGDFIETANHIIEQDPVLPWTIDIRVKDYIGQLAKQHGWEVRVEILDYASRKQEKDLTRRMPRWQRSRYHNPFSDAPTVYDHFGFLARNQTVPAEARPGYAELQREVRHWSYTASQPRMKDLGLCVESGLRTTGAIHVMDWRENGYSWLDRYGEIEGIAYQLMRKLAGLAKIFRGTDAKAAIKGCFENPRIPFYARLLEQFEVVLEFGADIESVITESAGQPSQTVLYGLFLDERLPVMARAVAEMFRLVESEFKKRTLLETIADYDREAPKSVIVSDQFDKWFKEWQKEGTCAAVHWWCVGDRVYLYSPTRAYIEDRGQMVPLVYQAYHNSQKLDPRRITSEGRAEIVLGHHPVPNNPYIYARPSQAGRPDYRRAAELACEAVIAKLREILPADIAIITPSP